MLVRSFGGRTEWKTYLLFSLRCADPPSPFLYRIVNHRWIVAGSSIAGRAGSKGKDLFLSAKSITGEENRAGGCLWWRRAGREEWRGGNGLPPLPYSRRGVHT